MISSVSRLLFSQSQCTDGIGHQLQLHQGFGHRAVPPHLWRGRAPHFFSVEDRNRLRRRTQARPAPRAAPSLQRRCPRDRALPLRCREHRLLPPLELLGLADQHPRITVQGRLPSDSLQRSAVRLLLPYLSEASSSFRSGAQLPIAVRGALGLPSRFAAHQPQHQSTPPLAYPQGSH